MSIGPISSRHEAFKQVCGAMLTYMYSVSICIVGFKGGEPYEIGSGTCVKIGSRYLIATAAHVIKQYSNSEIRIVHTDEPNSNSITIINRGAVLDKKAGLDIAWLEIDPKSIGIFQKKFITLDRLTPNLGSVSDDIVFVYGFPAKLVDKARLSKKMFQATPIGYTTTTKEITKWPIDKNLDRHILLDWPQFGNISANTGTQIDLPEPYGISGGGIWKININNGGIWSPENACMIGIEYSWKEEERWLCGNQIQHWIQLIKKDIPELSEFITT